MLLMPKASAWLRPGCEISSHQHLFMLELLLATTKQQVDNFLRVFGHIWRAHAADAQQDHQTISNPWCRDDVDKQ